MKNQFNHIPTIKCPKCGSEKVNTFRMPTGALWCESCGYAVTNKETDRSFLKTMIKRKS